MTAADLETAPFRVTQSVTLPASPEAVFAELADPSRWVVWWPMLKRAAWVSSHTASVGAEREVDLGVLGRFRERMLMWEPGVRFAFTMTESTSPLAQQMAEDYRLIRLGPATRLDWTTAVVPTGLGRVAEPLFRMILAELFRRASANLARVLRASNGNN
jgi:hypothetical protein